MAKLPKFGFLFSIICLFQFFVIPLNGFSNNSSISSPNEQIAIENLLTSSEQQNENNGTFVNKNENTNNGSRNGQIQTAENIKQMSTKKAKNITDEPGLFVAFVFGVSFRVPREFSYGSSSNWPYFGLGYDLSKFYSKMAKYYHRENKSSFMTIFPNSNDTELAAQCWSDPEDFFHDLYEQINKHYDTAEGRQAADIGADIYEPERELNSALMDRAEAIILNCVGPKWVYPRQKIKIVYITNFAEKKFARRNFSALEAKIPGLGLPVILLALNGATYNYHFYSLNEKDRRGRYDASIVVHLGIPEIDRIEFAETVWGDYYCRHVIYMVALSNNLLDWHSEPVDRQFFTVNLAIKEPLERDLDFDNIHTAVLMLSPCFLGKFSDGLNYFYMEPSWATNWGNLDKTMGCLLNSNQAVIETGRYDYDSRAQNGIVLMLNTAMAMYDRRLGATLPSDRRNDSLRPMLQKERPTIVLVTDIFQENFVDHLPDDRFLLKVYALNSSVYQRYKSIERVDFVRLLNPSKPGEIPIRMDRAEPPEWDGQIGLRGWQIAAIVAGGGMAFLIVSIIGIKMCRKYRLTRKE